MLSKSQVSLIKSLHQKKHRKENQLFLVEGLKSISEFLTSGYNIHSVYAVKEILSNLPILYHKQKVFEVSTNQLEKISTLQNPQGMIAIFEIPHNANYEPKHGEITLVLDDIQDPGNLGTIIRTADWFGFKHIICSENTVEAYNPKVVQATMGSLARVEISYMPLYEFLVNNDFPKFGTLLNGTNIYQTIWPNEGFLIFGNEGKGISDDILNLLTHKITIPGNMDTESLNVATAVAIFCSEIKRNNL